MTTIIAIQSNKWAVAGADTRSTDSTGSPVVMATSKIINNSGILIAGAGSVRGCNIMQFQFQPPKPVGDLDKYMSRRFIPAMRKAFQDGGFDIKQDSQAAEHDSEFIVIVRGNVYLISDDYSWERSRSGVYAIGSGSAFALGALAALNPTSKWDDPLKAETDISQALDIAARYDIYTSAPFDILMQRKAVQ